MTDYYESSDITRVVRIAHGTNRGLFFGFGAIVKFGEILDDLKPSCVGFVSSPTAYQKCGLWDTITKALAERGIEYLHYNGISTNPTVEQIDEAVDLFRAKYGPGFLVCGIGGGSPCDSAKAVSILLEYSNNKARELYKGEFEPKCRSKLVLVNLTHGTGTECDRYSVASILTGELYPIKSGIGFEFLYPDYSIDDINGLFSLSPDMVRFTTIDALNHVMEASTTTIMTPYVCTLTREAVYLIVRYLPIALAEPDNLRARYWLSYAAAIAGMAIDESGCHLTHLMEHTLSAYRPRLAHGRGLALLQPAVLKHIWPKVCGYLNDLFRPILGNLKGTPDEAEQAFRRMRAFHNKVGFSGTLTDEGFNLEDVDTLTDATLAYYGAKATLSITPVPTSRSDLQRIFAESFYRM
ncbi:Alcohol dehydrogenase 3 [Giardia duodenalis]|uniref:Alcohol dehydrogenase 3 n=2 Tax=Giardia intestinalis TaxID=5741 RepID=E2RU89_GIAIC|nr:Alcohol dehydrogenase 3 [Giardia intestinalis]AAF45302.1 alcohol dehydrogenase [Giardia intestinalis]AAO21493.1 alcohol dehydrogenase 2 [Giardia intestinalis]KAE8302623.1 Alcohol dehydrogenase 3 [Giardia intestinalis]|eukprot:XP_001706932.1 Alcohol dehydrogenase 3 lateral transfer candidate [Giardia lamblia ATCC 50803]